MAIFQAQGQVLQPLGAGGGGRQQDGDAHHRAQIREGRRQQLIHGLREHRDLIVGGVGQAENRRADDQHRQRRRAHDDEQAAEGLAALLRAVAAVGRHQVGEHLDAGHQARMRAYPPKVSSMISPATKARRSIRGR